MDNITQIKNQLAKLHAEGMDFVYAQYDEKSFGDGFQAAMDLQLPALFLKWVTESRIVYSATHGHYIASYGKVSGEELYKYWLENIYSPEPKK